MMQMDIRSFKESSLVKMEYGYSWKYLQGAL